MLYERNKLGGGKIFGEDAFVCKTSHLDRMSFAADQADIWASEVHHSKIFGDSKIRASVIEDFSEIGSSRLPVEITQSHIVHSIIRGGGVAGAYVIDSKITGRAQIRGDITQGGVKIIDSRIKGYAIVEGTAIVKGITLEKRMRINAGVWLRPPRYYDLIEPELCDIGITEGTDGTAAVGCTFKPMTTWIKKRKLWVAAGGWTDDMGKRLENLFTEWLDTRTPTN